MRIAWLLPGAVLVPLLSAQTAQSALMPNDAVAQSCQRSIQLMQSGGVAIPDLKSASAPVIENVRLACEILRQRGGAGQATYNLMANLRAYLELADAVPKPFPFPDAARAQIAELRDASVRLDAHFRALLDSKDAQLRSPDRDNLARYAEANSLLGPPVAGKPRVVFFGDSITSLWRLNEYFPERDFVNRGIGGQISGEMVGRMKADVLDLRPQAVLILAGTNDLARNVPVKTIEDNLAMMAELASGRGIKVILASVLPVSDYKAATTRDFTEERPPAYIRALNDWVRSYCNQNHHIYLNYFDAVADLQGKLTDEMSDDGLHPNAKGYRAMAPLALDAITKALTPAPAEAKPQKRR
jgi:acyl-CoA thioesterase-1